MEFVQFLIHSLIEDLGLLAVDRDNSPLRLIVGDQYEHCLWAATDQSEATWGAWESKNDSTTYEDGGGYYDPLCKFIWKANEAFFKFRWAQSILIALAYSIQIAGWGSFFSYLYSTEVNKGLNMYAQADFMRYAELST